MRCQHFLHPVGYIFNILVVSHRFSRLFSILAVLHHISHFWNTCECEDIGTDTHDCTDPGVVVPAANQLEMQQVTYIVIIR